MIDGPVRQDLPVKDFSFLRSRSDGVQRILADSLPWSPHDFVREISLAGDRAVLFAHVLRELPDQNDLRIVCECADTELAVCAERLPWDSAFFGYDVARLHGVYPLRPAGYSPDADYAAALRILIALARNRGIRYLFANVDSRDLPTIRALGAVGFSLIETRGTFFRSLRDYRYPRRFRCRMATAADVEALAELAATVGNPYDRFHADPFIPRETVSKLMRTWVRASIVQGFADAAMVPEYGTANALATVRYHREKWSTWGVSLAQVPFAVASRTGTGAMVRVFAEVTAHLKELGASHVFLTTQVANRAVTRIVQSLDYKLAKGEHVFRLLL